MELLCPSSCIDVKLANPLHWNLGVRVCKDVILVTDPQGEKKKVDVPNR